MQTDRPNTQSFAVFVTALAIVAASILLRWTSSIVASADQAAVRQTVDLDPVDTRSERPCSQETPEPEAIRFAESVIGNSVDGRPIHCLTFGESEYVVLIMASIHGNESAGTPLLHRLVDRVVKNPELLNGSRLVLIPSVNPDGVADGQRFNRRGVDLNRNFPAENRKNSSRYGLTALSEPEALAVYETINNEVPNHIVTLHEPLQCVDFDGPAAELARRMSEHSPLPVKKLGSRPGSLGSYAGVTLGIPTVTLELPGNASNQSVDYLWRFYGESLLQALLYRHPGQDDLPETP